MVFDVDGEFAPFEYGVHCHDACLDSEWKINIQTHDVYGSARPVKMIQRMIWAKDPNHIFVCSQADEA